ncbi:hypothetical protein [Agarivorans aestuarii]|uniref:hypothetical protein n=1 Tax=Agarivorans aestuarii TaxID=1563703 RepID=UPI001C82383D|nr:hypothetical protein [Agarivorans aestuarii]
MQIYAPKLYQDNGSKYESRVELNGASKVLWFNLQTGNAEQLSTSCDAALIALLIPAMLKGQDITIHGPLSEKLLFNAQVPLQSILCSLIPRLKRISITATNTLNTTTSSSGVATGFSAGIDSYATLSDYYKNSGPKQLSISHLLFNNVGSHGKEKANKLFNSRFKKLHSAASELNLPFLKIDSNLEEFYGRELDFQLTHTIRNASVALLLQPILKFYLYSSAYSYESLKVEETYDIAFADAMILPLIATESLTMLSVGSEYSRVEKTLKVSKLSHSYKHLDVCVLVKEEAHNCSKCSKCMRTLLTLELSGKLQHYSEAFDLPCYFENKNKFIIDMIFSDDPLHKEIVQFAKNKKISFPVHLYIFAIFSLLRKSLARTKFKTKKLLKAIIIKSH